MSVIEERLPFTPPLTSTEFRYIRERIDEVLRQNGRHVLKNNGTHNIDFEQEVEEAIEAFNRLTPRMVANLNREAA